MFFPSGRDTIVKNDWRGTMNTSSKYLQFEDPTILKFEFNVNEDFDFENSSEDDSDISTLVEMPGQDDIDFTDEVPVYLTVFVNYDNDNAPYKINMRILSLFKVSDLVTDEDAMQLLQTDGASILLSYLRPMVSMMTSASGFPAMTLPALDFSDSDDDD